MPITIQRSVIFFLFFFVQRWHRTDKALYIWTAHASIAIRYYYTRSRKSKWPELVAKYQVQWTRIMMNTRLDSSVRIKTRIHTEVTWNRICVNAHNSGSYETRLKCSQDWSRLGFVSALPQLRLHYALASISCEHCRLSRNNPHYAPRHIIFYCKPFTFWTTDGLLLTCIDYTLQIKMMRKF